MKRVDFTYLNQNFNIIFNFANNLYHSALLTVDGTKILCSITLKDLEAQLNFINLTVHFQEKHYSIGKIPKNKFKRETFPCNSEILISRLIDRSIRTGICNDINKEIHINIIAIDINNYEDVLGASILCSSMLMKRIFHEKFQFVIPVKGFILQDGSIVTVKDYNNEKVSACIIFSLNASGINMIELFSFRDIKQKVDVNHLVLTASIANIFHIASSFVNPLEKAITSDSTKEDNNRMVHIYHSIQETQINNFARYITAKINKLLEKNFRKKLFCSLLVKQEILNLKHNITSTFCFSFIEKLFYSVLSKCYYDFIIQNNIRPDGRGINDIRKIDIDGNIVQSCQDSLIFSRGQTKTLVTLTLGNVYEDLLIEENLCFISNKNVFAHYNFPEWSVGEVYKNKYLSRREIGHGKIFERSLIYASKHLSDENLVYRIVSDIISSDGSSSMASVCGGSILLHRNLQSELIAGISLGLLKHNDNFIQLVDLSSLEDLIGSIDLKIVSDKMKNIISLQMDSKSDFIQIDLIIELINKGLSMNINIINDIVKLIETKLTKSDNTKYVCKELKVNPKYFKHIIGFQGQNIKHLNESLNVKLFLKNDKVFLAGNENNISSAEVFIVNFLKKLINQ